MSVRELIEGMRREIRDSDLQPERASELLAKLTALIGSCLGEIREAEMVFNRLLLDCLTSEGAAAKAQIKAKTTDEYARLREAKDTHTVVVELVRSLRQVLRTAAEEMRLTR